MALKTWIVCAVCLLICHQIGAQNDAPEEQIEVPKVRIDNPKWALKTNLLNLTPWRLSASVGVDIRLYRNLALELDGGSFLTSFHASQIGESYRGPRLWATLKYHIAHYNRSVMYIGLMYKHYDIRNTRYRYLERQGGQFTEYALLGRDIKVRGGLLRYGCQFHLGPQKRLILEPSIAVGFSQRTIQHDPIPPDAEYRRRIDGNETWELRPGIFNLPDGMLGVYIGWRLR